MNTDTNSPGASSAVPTIATVHARLVQHRGAKPFRCSTPENINPIPGALKNNNPLHDPAEEVFRRETTERVQDAGAKRQIRSATGKSYYHRGDTVTSRRIPRVQDPFRTKLSEFGRAVWRQRDVRHGINRGIAHLHHEIEEEAIRGAGYWIAGTSDPEGVVDHWLALTPVHEWPWAIFRAAHREVDRLLRHCARDMAGETAYLGIGDETFVERVSGETFDVFATDETKLRVIAERCADLRERARQELAAAKGNRARGFIKRVLGMIDRAERYACACVASERFPFATPITFEEVSEQVESRVNVRKGGKVVARIRDSYKVGTGKTVSKGALAGRALRLNRFLDLLAA